MFLVILLEKQLFCHMHLWSKIALICSWNNTFGLMILFFLGTIRWSSWWSYPSKGISCSSNNNDQILIKSKWKLVKQLFLQNNKNQDLHLQTLFTFSRFTSTSQSIYTYIKNFRFRLGSWTWSRIVKLHVFVFDLPICELYYFYMHCAKRRYILYEWTLIKISRLSIQRC